MLRRIQNIVSVQIPGFNGISKRFFHIRIAFFQKLIIAAYFPFAVQAENCTQLSVGRRNHFPGGQAQCLIRTKRHISVFPGFYGKFHKPHGALQFRKQKSRRLCIVPDMGTSPGAASDAFPHALPAHKRTVLNAKTGRTS